MSNGDLIFGLQIYSYLYLHFREIWP